MADSNVHNMTAETVPVAGDFLYLSKTSGGPLDRKLALSVLKTFCNDLSALNASNLNAGTIPDARFPGTLPALNASLLTAINASAISTGTVPTARLGTGTADNTTYLRGDGTWATPSGGGGGGGDALTTNPLSQFAATTSAQLRGVLSDETGTGAAVFGTSPTIASPTFTGTSSGLSASDIGAGTLPDARFPATLPAASAVNLTAINASNIASGTIGTGRLGSGTADSTTFLRGDQVWAVPGGVTAVVSKVASATIALSEVGKMLSMNVGTANTLTIPPNSSVALTTGMSVNFLVVGAGTTTITAGAGVTLNNVPGGTAACPTGSIGTVFCQATDVWFTSVINLSVLNASNLTTGTVPDARFPSTLPALNGSALTALNASNLASGTVAIARLGSSGTPSSTTFLRGDGAWATPSVTGGTIITKDEGSLVDAAATTLNFVGAGVVATNPGAGVTTVTISGGSGSGALVKVTVVTSGVTFTTQASTTAARVRCIGGGGGGGGVLASAASGGGAAGGAGGGYCEKYYTGLTGSHAYTIAIGAAGSGGASGNNNGTAGGDTTFTDGTTLITAKGGGAGSGRDNGGTTNLSGAICAISTNGDINSAGSPGGPNSTSANSGADTSGAGGYGGSPGAYGAGAGPQNVASSAVAGLAGRGFGAGGGAGVSSKTGSGGSNQAGGNGTAGCIIVEEYA